LKSVKIAAAVLALSTMASGAALAASGPFTQQQAEDGHGKFNTICAQCHRPDLKGALGPSLVDDKFKEMFAGKPVSNLRDFIYENMPATAPKSLTEELLNPITAYILSKNGVQPGDKPLTKETASADFPK
jgi:S-disulfanyl-L-cysteine oxidoreductase SoxD